MELCISYEIANNLQVKMDDSHEFAPNDLSNFQALRDIAGRPDEGLYTPLDYAETLSA